MIGLPFLYISIGTDPSADIEKALANWSHQAIEILQDLSDENVKLSLQMVRNQAFLMFQMFTPVGNGVYASVKTPIFCCKFAMQPCESVYIAKNEQLPRQH